MAVTSHNRCGSFKRERIFMIHLNKYDKRHTFNIPIQNPPKVESQRGNYIHFFLIKVFLDLTHPVYTTLRLRSDSHCRGVTFFSRPCPVKYSSLNRSVHVSSDVRGTAPSFVHNKDGPTLDWNLTALVQRIRPYVITMPQLTTDFKKF